MSLFWENSYVKYAYTKGQGENKKKQKFLGIYSRKIRHKVCQLKLLWTIILWKIYKSDNYDQIPNKILGKI